jgi:hypothetical protein
MNVEALIAQHEICAEVLGANTADITHEESLRAPRDGGNCLNWAIGHLVWARAGALEFLGSPGPIPKQKFARYAQGQPPLTEASEALAFGELIENFKALQLPLTEALRAATPELLSRPAPNSPTGNPKETIGSLVVAVAFHEAYHLGQAGLLRHILGKQRLLP